MNETERMSEQRKVAFVTGAASGLGRAAAEAFIAKGYATVLTDLDEERGCEAEAALRHRGECMFIRCDVADDGAVASAMRCTADAYGRLDAAFNAAGIEGEMGSATADCTMDNWNRVIAINLTGLWSCMRRQIPLMIKSGGGSIVNCSAVAGIVGAPFVPAYVAAKHGVVGITKAAALEYGSQGIRVNAVCPGVIDTPMLRHSLPSQLTAALIAETPVPRMGTPAEVAATVLWLCEEAAAFITGQAIAVDGGWTAR